MRNSVHDLRPGPHLSSWSSLARPVCRFWPGSGCHWT